MGALNNWCDCEDCLALWSRIDQQNRRARRAKAGAVAVVAAIIALLLSSGCTALTKRPAHLVAPIGVQLLTAVSATQDVIIALGRAGSIPAEQERTAIEATVKIGHAGKRLATALRALDTAQTAILKAQATGEVSALLDVLNGLVFEALAPFTDASVRAQVAGLLREVNALLLTISGAIVRVTSAQPAGAVNHRLDWRAWDAHRRNRPFDVIGGHNDSYAADRYHPATVADMRHDATALPTIMAPNKDSGAACDESEVNSWLCHRLSGYHS